MARAAVGVAGSAVGGTVGGEMRRERMERGLAEKGENGGEGGGGRNIDNLVEYNSRSCMFVHNRAHIFEKATESTHNDTVFSVLMTVPCTMVCYLVGMLFTHVHNKKEKKKERNRLYYFHI